MYLSALEPFPQRGRYERDRNAAGGALDIGGLEYERGLGVRPDSKLTYRLHEEFARFDAWVGLDTASEGGTATFRVYVDGRLAFDSGALTHVAPEEHANPNRPVGVKVPLEGVRELRLEVSSPADSGGGVLSDWADARLRRGVPDPCDDRSAPPPGTLAPTPPMGWNSWNRFGTEIDERLILEMTDALVARGFRDAGYEYMCLDDGWQGARGDEWNRQRFPSGMKALGDAIHARGLKFGIYSRPEWVRGDEGRVAAAFASWGVDYLKYDFSDQDGEETNRRMVMAVRDTGRPIVFNICEWGKNRPWRWGARIGGQSWRVTYDVVDTWYTETDAGRGLGILKAVDQTEALGSFQRPGCWNDPDMLVVGLRGSGREIKGDGCTDAEYRAHFGLWCLLSAPLLAAVDLRDVDPTTAAILTNTDVIALDQDPLGIAAWRAHKLAGVEVWQKPLDGGALAVGLLNRGPQRTAIAVEWGDLGLAGPHRVRDLWKREDAETAHGRIEREVDAHDLALLRLSRA